MINSITSMWRRSLFTAVVLAAASGSAWAEESSLAEKGKEIATKLCARCHSITREGASPFAEAPPFRTFVEKWPVESLEEALAEGIVVGHPAMPEFVFGPEEIQNLLSYIGGLGR